MKNLLKQLPLAQKFKPINWTIQSKLQALLMMTSLGTLLLIGGISWHNRKMTLSDRVGNHLTNLRVVKAEQLDLAFNTLYYQVWMLSQDSKVIQGMVEFNKFYQQINDNDIPTAWNNKIEKYYKDEFLPQLKTNLSSDDLEASSYLPRQQATQYLQFHYIVDNPNSTKSKNQLLDAGDDSAYTKIHPSYQKLFRGIVEKLGYQDLYLINHKTGEIVYSVNKKIDFGTNILEGYNSQSGLAQLVKAIQFNPTKDIIQIADFAPYKPTYGSPRMFLGVPIYSGVNVVGILAVQLSPEKINTLINNDNNWKTAGLGDTGEVYLIGPDFLMRSDSRVFRENPQKYANQMTQQGTQPQKVQMSQKLNTTVALQQMQTPSSQKALGGETGILEERNYLGIPVMSSYAPLNLPGLNWAIIAAMEMAEIYRPLYRLGLILLIGAVIFSLLSSLLAAIAAKWLTQPLQLIANHIKSVLEEKSSKMMIEAQYKDEYQELTQQVNNVLGKLYDNTLKLQRKEQESNTLLENILPKKIADRWRNQERLILDNIQQITVVSARIVGLLDVGQFSNPKEQVELLNKLFDEFDQQALRQGLERQSSEGANYLAICGLTQVYFDNLQSSVQFALGMIEVVQAIKQKYNCNIGITIGIHSGSVTAAVVGTKKFDYRVWGETLYLANILRDTGQVKYVTITKPIFEALQEKFTIENWSILHLTTILPLTEVDLIQSSFDKVVSRAYQVGETFYN
jgi:class 3 adenylate cyclase